MLVLEADADDQPGEQPLALVSTAQDPGHDIHQRHPDEHVEGRRGEQVPQCHRRPRRGRCQRRHRLSCPSCAELSGNQGDEHHDDGHRHGRQHPQAARVRAERPLREAAEQRGQGRLVVVPPGGMARGDTEVQLVPVIAVAVRRRNQQQELGGCDRQYEHPGDSIPPMTQGGPTVSRRFRGRRAGSRTQKTNDEQCSFARNDAELGRLSAACAFGSWTLPTCCRARRERARTFRRCLRRDDDAERRARLALQVAVSRVARPVRRPWHEGQELRIER